MFGLSLLVNTIKTTQMASFASEITEKKSNVELKGCQLGTVEEVIAELIAMKIDFDDEDVEDLEGLTPGDSIVNSRFTVVMFGDYYLTCHQK